MEYKNPMQTPRIEKVVINIGVGQSGEKLARAEKLLEKITERKPMRTFSKHKIPSWNLKKNEPIGCKVTLRGKNAQEFLKKALYAKDNKLSEKNFDGKGNLSFGIHEYIDLPNVKYDPEIGVFGMNICVYIERPGFRIKRRKIKISKIPRKAIINKDETIDFFKENFKVDVVK